MKNLTELASSSRSDSGRVRHAVSRHLPRNAGDTGVLGGGRRHPVYRLVPGSVKLFTPSERACKIPRSLNTVRIARPHPLFEGIENESEFYFVHSYYPAPSDSAGPSARRTTPARASLGIGCGNLFATQFHPERSGRIACASWTNFARWTANADQTIIPCLDVRARKVTKGVKFQGNIDLATRSRWRYPTATAAATSSFSTTSLPRRVSADRHRHGPRGRRVVHIPFAVGGGIRAWRTCSGSCWRARRRCR